jgi:hypothetical protein
MIRTLAIPPRRFWAGDTDGFVGAPLKAVAAAPRAAGPWSQGDDDIMGVVDTLL